MIRNDPVLAYNFLVTFVDSASSLGSAGSTLSAIGRAALGGFSEASGLEMSLEVEDYKEGGRNDTVHKFPTRITWANLRLKRGIALSDDLWQWHYGFVEGGGQRRDLTVTLMNDLREPVRVWQVRRGLPVKWTGPAMNAARGEVAVEELEIAHEGLKLVSASTLMSAGELVSKVGQAGSSAVAGARGAVASARNLTGL